MGVFLVITGDSGIDKLEISDSVIEKTTKCEHDFSCLSGDKTCLCEIDDSGKTAAVQIKPKHDLSCHYCFSFNISRYCCAAPLETKSIKNTKSNRKAAK